MKRDDIRGWTWKLGSIWVEVVTYKHRICCVALSRNHGHKYIARWE